MDASSLREMVYTELDFGAILCVDEHLSPANKKGIAVKKSNNIRKNAVNILRIRRKALNLRHEKDAKT